MMKAYFNLFISLLCPLFIYAQAKPIGSWTEYLPYQKGKTMVKSGDLLYCGTTTGLFTYNLSDHSISRFSTVNRLNHIAVEKLAYADQNKILLVVYNDLNIDLLKGEQTINISAIKDASLSNKSINSIFIKEPFAYLSTGFGIIKLDLVKEEISETYRFAQGGGNISVNASYLDEQSIYAATDEGVFKAPLSLNLLDFSNWSRIADGGNRTYEDIFQFQDQLLLIGEVTGGDSLFQLQNEQLNSLPQFPLKNYIDRSLQGDQLLLAGGGSAEFYDAQLQQQSTVSFATNNLKALSFSANQIYVFNDFHPLLIFNKSGDLQDIVKPNGPFEENIFDVEVEDGILWAVSGGYNQSYNNLYRGGRIYNYQDGGWNNYIDFEVPSLGGAYDLISVNVNPKNPMEAYFGSWGVGMLEFKSQLPFQKYNETNSILRDRILRPGWVAIGETTFDKEENLWIVNSYTKSLLSVRKKDGSWKQFSFPNLESGDETVATGIEVTNGGIKWLALPFDNQILVFDDNGTIDNPSDDRSLVLRQGSGQGDVPGIRGVILAVDLENQMWVGTSDGLAVNYNPDDIFESNSIDLERILIDDGENVEVLLGGTEINEIAIDGANRKWIATAGSGVYLLSPNGEEEVLHFTTENSPLFSDNILSLSIDEESGEVYIATAGGLISYRSDVISGAENLADVTVYPNPVRESYRGPIAIKGLMDRSTVKITDLEGRLVYEIESEGGQAIWDGRNFSGQRVNTGVYLVFSSAQNEEENLKTAISKILFIK